MSPLCSYIGQYFFVIKNLFKMEDEGSALEITLRYFKHLEEKLLQKKALVFVLCTNKIYS